MKTNATVQSMGREHLQIKAAPGYTVIVFRCRDGSAEAIVIDGNQTETTRLSIDAPAAGQVLRITRSGDDVWDILYDPPRPPLSAPEAPLCQRCGIHYHRTCSHCGE